MIRLIALDIVLFLAPFAAYALYLLFTSRTVGAPEEWTLKVIGWLGLAGAGLIVVVMLVFIHFDAPAPGGTYVPAHMEDGVLVPGQIVRDP